MPSSLRPFFTANKRSSALLAKFNLLYIFLKCVLIVFSLEIQFISNFCVLQSATGEKKDLSLARSEDIQRFFLAPRLP